MSLPGLSYLFATVRFDGPDPDRRRTGHALGANYSGFVPHRLCWALVRSVWLYRCIWLGAAGPGFNSCPAREAVGHRHCQAAHALSWVCVDLDAGPTALTMFTFHFGVPAPGDEPDPRRHWRSLVICSPQFVHLFGIDVPSWAI